MNGPYYLTLDEETGTYFLHDERDSAYAADCGRCSREEAEQYRDAANRNAEGD